MMFMKNGVMKKFMFIFLAAMLPLVMSAQAQINTKKAIIADFPSKVMKVVKTGDAFLDISLSSAVKDCWRLSPYEFCTLDDFNALMGSDEYYFLLVIDTQFRKEEAPGLKMLTLIKGGKRAEKGIGKMLEVISVPLCSADDPTGRELVFMPALIDIIQTQVEASMAKDLNAYGGLGILSKDIGHGVRIALAEGDVSFDHGCIPPDELDRVAVMDDDEVDELFLNEEEDVLVSYSVWPAAGEAGSYCYNMLINAKSHKLCYFRRYRITANSGVGFTEEDLNKIL